MFHFIHTYNPEPILITLGPINVYWYGLFIVSGILVAVLVILKLAGFYNLRKDTIVDSAFWLIIGGIIGARLYHVLLETPFYISQPLNIIKIWHGGLAIHGGIFAGIMITWIFAKKNKLNFWLLSSVYVTGLSLAQAIGRWGNYFNQELFGAPTGLPWGIPILPENRIAEFYNFQYFHPTFLYESLGSLLIFFILLAIHIWIIKKGKFHNPFYFLLLASYFVSYSLLRFSLEFIRVDITPAILGLRFPQLISLLVIAVSLSVLYFQHKKAALEKN